MSIYICMGEKNISIAMLFLTSHQCAVHLIRSGLLSVLNRIFCIVWWTFYTAPLGPLAPYIHSSRRFAHLDQFFYTADTSQLRQAIVLHSRTFLPHQTIVPPEIVWTAKLFLCTMTHEQNQPSIDLNFVDPMRCSLPNQFLTWLFPSFMW